jgi:hypothetical protein
MEISQLKKVDEDEGRFVQFDDAADTPLFDGDGDEKTPVGAVVSGTYSKHYRAAHRKLREDGWQRSKRGDNDVDIDTIDEGELVLQVACIRSWTFTSGGAPFPITVENWKALLENQPQFQRKVVKQMNDHASFFRA